MNMMKKYVLLLSLGLYLNAAWGTVRLLPRPVAMTCKDSITIRLTELNWKLPEQHFPARTLAIRLLDWRFKQTAQANFTIHGSIVPQAKHRDGYRIISTNSQITVVGNSNRGLFNGLMTLRQLMDKTPDGHCSIQLAEITDYPAWQQRFQGNLSLFTRDNLDLAAMYKFGGLTYQYRDDFWKLTAKTPHGGSLFNTYGEAFAQIKDYAKYDVLDFMFICNIYATRGKRTKPTMNIAKEEDIQGFADRCRLAARNGFTAIMVAADDWTPMKDGYYTTVYPEERRLWGNNAGKAHGILMRKLIDSLKNDFPDLKWSFCPPVYSLRQHNATAPKMAAYLSDLGKTLPQQVQVIWTGPDIVSPKITLEQERTYAALINGHHTGIWDNSNCIIYPIHRWICEIDPRLARDNSVFFVNNKSFDGGLWATIFALNANDYLWNMKDFHIMTSHQTAFEKIRPNHDYQQVREFQDNFQTLMTMTPQNYDRNLLAKLKQAQTAFDRNGLNSRWLHFHVASLAARLETKKPHTTIPFLSQPPVLDGNPKDSSWQFQDFKTLRTRHDDTVPPAQRTHFKMIFDREAIYVLIECKFTGKQPGQNIGTAQDFFMAHDLAELFFVPAGTENFIQFAVQPNGRKFFTRRGTFGSQPHWEAKCSVRKDRWFAELKLPFKLFYDAGAKPPSDKTVWLGNVCREYNARKSLQCWSPTFSNSFLTTDMYGTLEFKELQ